MRTILTLLVVFLVPAISSAEMTREELKTMTATVINMNGGLCAEVVNISPLVQKGLFEVRCIEYRGGTGTVDYIMDANKGTAFKR